MVLKNLELLSNAELKNYFNSFDTVLVSGFGTLWTAKEAISGVQKALSLLRIMDKKIVLLPTSSSSLEEIHQKTTKFKLNFDADEIVIPILAIVDYFKSMEFDKELFVLGSPSAKQFFGSAGFTVANPGPDTFKDSLDEFKNNITDNPNIGAVVFDFDPNLNYTSILKALTYLERSEVRYITAVSERNIEINSNLSILGQEFFQAIIKKLSCKPPIKFGKPFTNFSDFIESRYGNEKSRTLYISNSVDLDMQFASRAHYEKLLIVSDDDLEEVEEKIKGQLVVDYYITSFGRLTKLIERKEK